MAGKLKVGKKSCHASQQAPQQASRHQDRARTFDGQDAHQEGQPQARFSEAPLTVATPSQMPMPPAGGPQPGPSAGGTASSLGRAIRLTGRRGSAEVGSFGNGRAGYFLGES